MFSIIYGLVVVFLLILVAFIIVLRSEQSEKNTVFGGLEAVLFLVMMPKNDSKSDETAKKEEKILISHMEQVLANFLYLKKPKIFGEPPSIALEIASEVGGAVISF